MKNGGVGHPSVEGKQINETASKMGAGIGNINWTLR